MDLTKFARVSLCHQPTPLEPLDRLSRWLGGPRILVKRDDQTGLAGGGNKARKLEFLLAEAIEQKADVLVTVGALQSNHARQTAGAAAKLGVRCELILQCEVDWPEPAYQYSGNVLLDDLLGAKVHRLDKNLSLDAAAQERLTALRAEGARPYFIPVGGSNRIGALGYAAATVEVLEQADAMGISFGAMVVATGSGGTHAGIVAALAGMNRTEQVVGVAVSGTRALKEDRVRTLARETARLLGNSPDKIDEWVNVTDKFVGPGYGIPAPETIEAVRMTAQLEGLLLDPVYTGKAMAGLFGLVRKGVFSKNANILFWHTGGTPALYVYASAFDDSK